MDMKVSMLLKLVDQFTQPLERARTSLGQFRKGVEDNISKPFKKGAAPLFDPAQFEANIERSNQRIAAARARLLGAFGQALVLSAPIKLAAGFDQSFKGLEKVVEAPLSRLQELREFALDTSAKIPVAARDIVELMAAAAQGGVPQEALEAFTLFTTRASVAADIAGQEIGDIFAKLRNNYKLTQDGIEALGDSANHLSNSMAAKAAEIFDFTNRAAGAAEILKFNAVQMNAIGAALVASGIVPETAARGFNAFANKVLTGGKAIDAALKSVDVSREDLLAGLRERGPEAFADFLETLAQKGDAGTRALAEIVGLDFADDFTKLLGNTQTLRQALDLVKDPGEFKGSIFDEAAKQAEGAEKRTALLFNKITKAGIQIGDVLLPVFLEIVDGVGKVIDTVSAWAAANPELFGMLVKLAAGALALGIALRLLSFGFALVGGGVVRAIPVFARMASGLRQITPSAIQASLGLARIKGAFALLAPTIAGGLGALKRFAGAARALSPINWAAIVKQPNWGLLIKPLVWFGKGATRLIPVIGWTLFAAEVGFFAWDAIIKPLGWDKFIDIDGLTSLMSTALAKIGSLWDSVRNRISGAFAVPATDVPAGATAPDAPAADVPARAGRSKKRRPLSDTALRETPSAGRVTEPNGEPSADGVTPRAAPGTGAGTGSVSVSGSVSGSPSGQASAPARLIEGLRSLDQAAGREIEGSADRAGKTLQEAGAKSGTLLGDQAVAALAQQAQALGAKIGDAAVSRISQANIKVQATVSTSGTIPAHFTGAQRRKASRAKGAALHDGVE
ncbi:MAG: phage tail tape measure protein [Rhizobiales bacterium]|nr:phage tail tape measure protein [Hyphomicrobiales bacterium]